MTHEPPTGWDASAHPGFERLAELEEGLLEPADATRVTDHVAGCEHCQGQQAQLGQTRALLRTLPAEQMPADVAARLDDALANVDTGATPSSQPATVVPLEAPRRRRRVHPTAAGLGAAAAVAALVAALVVGHTSGGSSGGGSAGQTTGLAQPPASTVLNGLSSTASGTDYTTHNLATSVPRLVTGPSTQTMTKAAPIQPNTGAGTNSSGAGGAAAATGIPAALLRLHDSADALRSCVLGIEAGGNIERPLAIDFAHYQGAPAVLVVLPGLTQGFLDAWFVGPACSDSDAHLLGYKAIPSSASPSPAG